MQKKKSLRCHNLKFPLKASRDQFFFPQQKIGNIDIFFITSNENKMEIGNTG